MHFRDLLNTLDESVVTRAELIALLDDLSPEEIDAVGDMIYDNAFEEYEIDDEPDSEPEDTDYELITKEEILELIDDMSDEEIDTLGNMIQDEFFEDEIGEAVSRVMKAAKKNRKTRKLFKKTKAELRKEAPARKKKARQTRAKRKRYYRANKKKLAAYQKSRAKSIKKGSHKVKKRLGA